MLCTMALEHNFQNLCTSKKALLMASYGPQLASRLDKEAVVDQ